MKYIVKVREVHIQSVEVEAETPAAAKIAVSNGDGDYMDNRLEYSHCLGPETWEVEESI